MSLQQQLHETCHSDRALRHRLLTSVDIPSLQEMLGDRQPRTAQQLFEPVGSGFRDIARSAGATVAKISQEVDNNRQECA